MSNAPRPIGYWLKRADELLTTHIDAAQQVRGLSRLDWQTLNVLRQTERPSLDHVAQALNFFADRPTIVDALAALEMRGVIERVQADVYVLTLAGDDLLARAHAAQQTLRRWATDGISETDYRTTIQTLHRLVENLEQARPAGG